MNPFDLAGPQFLLFYVVFSALVIVGVVVARRMAESSEAPKIDLSDPYLIAYLRGGAPEALRVAVVSLIDRGVLVVGGTQLTTAAQVNPSSFRKPIEAELLRKFKTPVGAGVISIYNDPRLREACGVYEQTLKNAELLPNQQIHQARVVRLLLAWLLLAGVALVKILIAISHGRTNFIFLILLTIVAGIVARLISFPRLTERGKTMVADLKNLYSGLKDRALIVNPGGATIESMMLAAVFGVGALAGANFAFTRILFPRVAKKPDSGSCASYGCDGVYCGSSSGSSSGSSCSSSCGGGGCGGGCGGCGG